MDSVNPVMKHECQSPCDVSNLIWKNFNGGSVSTSKELENE